MKTEPITRANIERKAKGAIRDFLSSVPGASFEVNDLSTSHSCDANVHDFDVQLTTKTGSQTLNCYTKARAWPNEIYAIAHRFQPILQGNVSRSSILVLIAPYISKQAAETCIELGLSWADFAGNGEIRLEGAYIKVQGKPNPYSKGRGTATLYSPKSAQVIHSLLLAPRRAWTTEGLSKKSGVSLGQVNSVKKLLESNSWIHASYGETVLVEPRKLLDNWVLHYKPKRSAIRLFTLDSPAQLEARITETVPEYAFAEFSAAERYASYTRHQRVAIYVPEWSEEKAKMLGLKGGDGSSNVTVYETGEPLLFTEDLKNARCASPILTYLDLKLLAGRGQDAAEHLLETIILPRWI